MRHRFASLTAVLLLVFSVVPALAADQEQQIGEQVYQELAQKGEIISSSPLYAVLGPITRRIKAVTDPQYDHPFRFILVHEKAPNAFAVPGGNVYVTDSLMRFVKTREELAGVLCHETSHTIHHDVLNNMRKDQNLAIGATIISILVGGGKNNTVNQALNLGAGIQAMKFSRAVETAADLKGSDTCAQAGYNPYGMIWLFERFEKANTGARAEFLSDHPRDDHRISDLETHFAQNPAVFNRFSSNISTATALRLSANTGDTSYPAPVTASEAPTATPDGPTSEYKP